LHRTEYKINVTNRRAVGNFLYRSLLDTPNPSLSFRTADNDNPTPYEPANVALFFVVIYRGGTRRRRDKEHRKQICNRGLNAFKRFISPSKL